MLVASMANHRVEILWQRTWHDFLLYKAIYRAIHLLQIVQIESLHFAEDPKSFPWKYYS